MRFLSIKTRVTIYFTLMMLLVVGLVLGTILIAGRGVISGSAEGTLIDAVHDEIDDVEYEGGFLDLDELDFYRHQVYIQVYSAAGELIGGAGASDFAGADEFKNGEIRRVAQGNGALLVYDLFLPDEYGGVWLRGVTDEDNDFSAARVITILALILLPVLVVITAVVGWLIARHAFKPVRQITDTVDAINDGTDLTARIGLHRGRDEIHRLAATFDSMFDRLERSFDAEKRFASDASHELRTPVAVILAECEYARENAKTAEDYAESLEVVERQGRRMSDIINQLLSITRLDQGTQRINRERADLSELADVVTDETVLASGKRLELVKDIAPGVTSGVTESAVVTPSSAAFHRVMHGIQSLHQRNGIVAKRGRCSKIWLKKKCVPIFKSLLNMLNKIEYIISIGERNLKKRAQQAPASWPVRCHSAR